MLTKIIGQVDRRRLAVDLPNSVTCRNRNETLKYPGRFLRDTEWYFRKTGTIFEKNRFRQIWSIISPLYKKQNFTFEIQPYNTLLLQWYRILPTYTKVMGSNLKDNVDSPFPLRNIIQNFDVQMSCSKFVGVWCDSICGCSWSQVDNITTWQYGMTPFLCATQVKLEILISIMFNVLSNKTILFDILDFWCQLVVIRFVKILSKCCMFVSSMKISACWILHRWIIFNKICWEKRPAKHGQTCGHRFADVIWRIPNAGRRTRRNMGRSFREQISCQIVDVKKPWRATPGHEHRFKGSFPWKHRVHYVPFKFSKNALNSKWC